MQAGTPVKDVTLPDDPSKKSLLLAKHADYIEAFEKDKDDYVCWKEEEEEGLWLISACICWGCGYTWVGRARWLQSGGTEPFTQKSEG